MSFQILGGSSGECWWNTCRQAGNYALNPNPLRRDFTSGSLYSLMVRAIVILWPRREKPTSISFFGERER